MIEKINKGRFLRNWTILHAAFFIIGYILLILFAFLMMAIFPIAKDEWGPPLLQSIWQTGNGILIGTSIGFIQWRLLRKTYSIPSSWIYLVPVGIIVTELIAGLFIWKMGMNRGDLAFWENNPLQHALIVTIYGFVIGLIQFPLLRKNFSRGAFWILASTLAWGASILITAIKVQDDLALLITLIIGFMLYGIVTGASLLWILKPREVKPDTE